MSQLEQILFKVYTDPQYRQSIQEGREKLAGLSDAERDAIKALSLHQFDGNGTLDDRQCDRR